MLDDFVSKSLFAADLLQKLAVKRFDYFVTKFVKLE